MLPLIICLSGIFAILVAEEILYKQKILRGEYLRKFVHISAGAFIAFWPWLISWRSIELISLAMLIVVLINQRVKTIHMSGDVARSTYGGILFPVGVLATALLTNNKVFFAVAVLNMALADGLAAIVGTAYGKRYSYKVFHQLKTVIGTMTFSYVSLIILGTGLLFTHEIIPFNRYVILLAALPPLLAAVENLAVIGLDNVAVPVGVVLTLNLAQSIA